MKSWLLLCLLGAAWLSGCKTPSQEQAKPNKIIALGGSVTETIFELGLDSLLVGVDVTSTYPPSLDALPRVGHVRGLSAEKMMALQPTLILDGAGMAPDVEQQLIGGGIEVVRLPLANQTDSAFAQFRQIGTVLNKTKEAEDMVLANQEKLASLNRIKDTATWSPKVVFIYSRGQGNLTVAGANTQADAMLQLAGATNPFQSQFEGFKPLTAEAMVTAAPDILFLFTDAYEAMGGMDGLLAVPGVAATPAGTNQRVVHLDGHFATGFGPRFAEAATTLFQMFHAAPRP